MIIELYLYSHIIVVHVDNGTKVYRILDEAALLIYSATMLLFCHGLVTKKPSCLASILFFFSRGEMKPFYPFPFSHTIFCHLVSLVPLSLFQLLLNRQVLLQI